MGQTTQDQHDGRAAPAQQTEQQQQPDQERPGPSSPTPSRTRAEYRPDIDGIRGAAAIMVMGFHARVPGFEGAYIGLDLFFVVSGYVIAGLLLHEHARTGAIRWGAFYARRARRLIPAKATMLVGVLLLSALLLPPTGAQQETARSAAAAATFVSNIFFWRATTSGQVDYFGHEPGTAVLLHTWSLSVEEQFYLAVPLLLLLSALLARVLRRRLLPVVLGVTVALAVGSLALAVAWATPHPEAAYYLPITRAFEFLMGVALALVVRRVHLGVVVRTAMGLVGAGLCAYALAFPLPVAGYPSWWALVPCTGALLMTWAGVGGATAVNRFLSIRLLVWLGLVSYGWYLWHWPVLVLGEAVNLAPPPLLGRVALVLLALGIAWLSYRYVEGIFYQRSGAGTRRSTWAPRRVILTGVATMASVAALAGGGLVLADQRATSPGWAAAAAGLQDHPVLPAACLEPGGIIPDRPTPCELRPFEPGRPTIVLWGDSHAWMFTPALERAAADRDVNLVAFTKGSCPPMVTPEDSMISCSKLNRRALQFVEKQAQRPQPLRVVLGASWETYRGTPWVGLMQERAPAAGNVDYVREIAAMTTDGMPELFGRLGELGVPVDVVGPTPVLDRSAPLCEAARRYYSCDTPRSVALRDEAENTAWLRDQVARLAPGSRLLDVADELCDEGSCRARRDGVVAYFDDNHLSATRAEQLAAIFEPTVREVLRAGRAGQRAEE